MHFDGSSAEQVILPLTGPIHHWYPQEWRENPLAPLEIDHLLDLMDVQQESTNDGQEEPSDAGCEDESLLSIPDVVPPVINKVGLPHWLLTYPSSCSAFQRCRRRAWALRSSPNR